MQDRFLKSLHTTLSNCIKELDDIHDLFVQHSYKINFATAVNICKEYLKHGGGEDEKMRLVQKHLTPIRPNRKYPLRLHPKRNRGACTERLKLHHHYTTI